MKNNKNLIIDKLKFEEIKTLLQYDDKHESKIYMPNEIFTDLQYHISSPPHIAFAYTYIYLCHWLYRYTKHRTAKLIDNKGMKQILGFHPMTKGLDYMVKRRGLLEEIGYLETVKDVPLYWTFEDEILEFSYLSELKPDEIEMYGIPNTYKIKRPTKAFDRGIIDSDGHEIEGAFYEVYQTHLIPFDIFLYCLNNDRMGCTGFYLYAYIKNQNQILRGGYDASLEKLSSKTAIPHRTLCTYLDTLKSYNMINCTVNQEYYTLGNREEDRKPNTYETNSFDQFTYEPIEYEKIEIMLREDYKEKLKKEAEAKWGKKIEIKMEDLPY